MLWIMLIALTGCYLGPGASLPPGMGDDQTDAPALPPTAEQVLPTPMPFVLSAPQEFPPDINPLTGLPADPSVLERRPMIVKISNAPAIVRPQAGLGQADHVFEHYAEGGLTRFSAVFYGQSPTRVGSIRSSRLIDDELMTMYHGLLAFSGASIGVEAIINAAPYFPRTYKGVLFGAPYYWREDHVAAPHNMYVNVDALWSLAAQQGHAQRPDLRGLAFDPAAPDGGTPAPYISVRYAATQVEWWYDEATSTYLRFSDGLIHADGNTGEQVRADNVVALYAAHTETDIVESTWQGVDSYSIAIDLMNGGEALLFRSGQRYPARWSRPEGEALFQFRTPEGDPLPFAPGVTWFQVLPPPETWRAWEGVSVSLPEGS